jgi:hypothetical protein
MSAAPEASLSDAIPRQAAKATCNHEVACEAAVRRAPVRIPYPSDILRKQYIKTLATSLDRIACRCKPYCSKLPMHLSPRCHALTRKGSPCQSPAMLNGRCRMHGGKAKGNSHAFKHGRYAAEHLAERRHFAELLRELRSILGDMNVADQKRYGGRRPRAGRVGLAPLAASLVPAKVLLNERIQNADCRRRRRRGRA